MDEKSQAVRMMHSSMFNTQLLRVMMVLLVSIITLLTVRDTVVSIIQNNVVINGLIITVFLFGVWLCLRNLYRLRCDFTVLRDLDSILFEHQDVALFKQYKKKMFTTNELFFSLQKSAEASGSIGKIPPSIARNLFDVARNRLDERRVRMGYLVNLLIHLGLLGTFIGLSLTVGSIHGLTSNLAAGLSGEEDLTQMLVVLIQQLEAPLSGMGTSFSTSLMGLSCSIMLGAMVVCLNKASMIFSHTYSKWLFECAMLTGNGAVHNEMNASASSGYPCHDSFCDGQAVLEKMHDRLQVLGDINRGQRVLLERIENSQLRQVDVLQDIYQEIQRQDIGQRLDNGTAAVLASMTEQGGTMADLTASVVGELEKQRQRLTEQGSVMANLTTELKTSVVGELERQYQTLKEQRISQESSDALAAGQREQLVAGQKAALECLEQANNTLDSLNHRVGKIPENTVPIVREAIQESAGSLEVSLLRRIRFMVKRYQRLWLKLLRVEGVKHQKVVETLSETLHAEQAEQRQAMEKQVAREGEKHRALLIRLFKALHRIYRRLLRKRF